MQRDVSERSGVTGQVVDLRGSRRFLCAIVPVALIAQAFTSSADAQGVKESKPPALVHAAGGFQARQLTSAPAINGREWIAVEVISGDVSTTVQAKDRTFSLAFREAGADTGDFERYRVYLLRGRNAPARIDNVFTGWVYVTPDSHYVFTEPLYALDVRQWKQYPLFDALGIQNYTSIEAVSRDGRRLFVSRSDCALDCRDQRREYYELTLPR